MQAFTVCLLGSVKTHLGRERKHPLRDNLLIMLQKLAGRPSGTNISVHTGRMRRGSPSSSVGIPSAKYVLV